MRVGLWRFKRSPQQRDRAAMIATFAFIGLFAIGSVDAVVTGGADFSPGAAYAMDYQPARVMPAQQPTAASPVELASAAAKLATEEVDYSFTTEVLLGGPKEIVANDQALGLEAAAPAATGADKPIL